MTVHVPRRPYVEALPGIPTIRAVRGARLRHPAGLARRGTTPRASSARRATTSSRATATRCARTCATCSRDRDARRARSREHGRATILARHTCAHRVDELLAIAARARRRDRAGRAAEPPREHRLLRLEPRLGVLERRGDLLPRPRPRARRARPPRHLLRARRLRPAAAPRHRRPAVGRGRRLRSRREAARSRARRARRAAPTWS